jgi:hypothetical protein
MGRSSARWTPVGQDGRVAEPRFGSVNVVVADVGALATFLAALDVDLEPTLPDWVAHHRSFEADVSSFDADLDSPSFAGWWGGVPEELVPGVVVNLRVDDRDEVDQLHRRAIEAGASELKSPWDAFWGSRYSVVLAPGPLCLGFMSEPEGSRRTSPPPIDEFA